MKIFKNLRFVMVLTCLLSLLSCDQEKTTTEEKTEIEVMDSTRINAKEATEKLEAQTKEVEASLEKLDNEFSSDNKR